jgi:hypothetical protein
MEKEIRMAEVERYMKEIVGLSSKTQEISKEFNRICGGSFEWATKEIANSYLSMFDRFCPFKVGDRVRLVKDYEVTDKSHGWYHCRHFLQKGALSTIITREYENTCFTFQIEFDRETWISSEDKIERPVTCKHTFYFREDYLEKVED